MKSNAGFVGFDGTENKRTILALQEVKKAAGIAGDINVLLRRPHGRARSIVSKFNCMFGVKVFVSENANREEWEMAGVRIDGGHDNFFEASDFIIAEPPDDKIVPNFDYLRKRSDLVCLTRKSVKLPEG